MLTLHTNWINILARLFLLLLFIFIEYCIIKIIIIDSQGNDKAIVLLYFMVVLFVYIIIAIISSFFQVLKVQVDKASGSVALSKIYSTKVFSKIEIEGYYTTLYISRTGQSFQGLLLKTNDNKSFRLIQANLKSIQELKQYFEQENLKYFGEKKARFSN